MVILSSSKVIRGDTVALLRAVSAHGGARSRWIGVSRNDGANMRDSNFKNCALISLAIAGGSMGLACSSGSDSPDKPSTTSTSAGSGGAGSTSSTSGTAGSTTASTTSTTVG